MFRRSLLLPALAPALMLGACVGTQNRGLESVHQPVVARQDYALDLAVAGDRLAAGEPQRLNGWLAAMRLRYGDRVALDDAGRDRSIQAEVQRVLSGYGLLLGDGRPYSPAPPAPGTVRVVVSRMEAHVPGCPDWSRDASHEFNSNTSSNYGCATNVSLAAMVARPEDLVHGQEDALPDPARSGKAIEAFRKAAPSGNGGTTVTAAGTK